MDEGQTRLLADETLEEIFNSHYENEDEFSIAVQELIKIYGNGRDEKIRALVLRLHHHSQTRPDAEKWIAKQIEVFSAAAPIQWREWFSGAICDLRDEWLPILQNLKTENPKAAECLEILRETNSQDVFRKISAANENWPRGTKKFREPLKDFFEDAKFLNSLVATKENDPLAEDWNWIRGHMKTLLQLAQEFSGNFSARKRDDGILDFHDLEQFALKLLWNLETQKPTEIAARWREKLKFIFVDEYQDINAAQDKIISALSREGADANRFLVGDVKQSIYRFRLADPKIFRDYARDWRGENGQTIALTENFRSRESLLDFVNSVFEPLMREEIGGMNYDDEAKLKFGGMARVDAHPTDETKAQLLLRFSNKRNDNSENENGNDEIADLEESEKEARMLGLRLLELKNSGHEIWDDETKKFRAADWRDMAILLRAPSGKAEIFAKQFERAGIPLVVERGGFYDSSEILDLLGVLQLLDNPLQDVPCIAVLRSPLVGLSLDELAEIRLLQSGKFWFALNQAQSPKSKVQSETRAKTEKFLKRFHHWRKLAQQSSLSQCVETILAETHYDDWLKSRPRGAQRHANVRRFLNLAEKFDQFQRQGLFRFLKFIEAQREIEAEPEVAPVADENAVRLMSIHQSKGLEFPVVALADLAKNFNEQDLRGEIILDEKFGLCPRVKPPKAGGRYPSLPYWLAQKNQRRELRGEELRLLYVAMTRARDNLILCGGISVKKWEVFFEKRNEISTREILSARSYLDWLGIWFGVQSAKFKVENAAQGELPHLRWRVVGDEELGSARVPRAVSGVSPEFSSRELTEEIAKRDASQSTPEACAPKTLEKLRDVLDWNYPFPAATKRAAKSSVTVLRREANTEMVDEAQPIFQNRKSKIENRKSSAADAGTAAHKFLQHFDFESAADLKSLEAEARRLEKGNYLSAAERAVLNLKNVAAFWDSEIGKKILSQKEFVRRELPFTAKFSPKELDKILGTKSPLDLENEFVVVQGVADLVVLLPKEIWIVDFKTDDVDANEIAGKSEFYSPQLKLYVSALAKIYSRPVTNCWLHFLSAQKTVDVKI